MDVARRGFGGMTPGARPRGAEEGKWRDPSKSPKITLRGPWTGENRENHFQNMTVRDDISLQKLSEQGKFPDDETFKLLIAISSASVPLAQDTQCLEPIRLENCSSNNFTYLPPEHNHPELIQSFKYIDSLPKNCGSDTGILLILKFTA